MASTPPIQTIPDVERLLEERKDQLERLISQREQIQKQIDDLDRQMQGTASVERPRRKPGKPRLSNTGSLKTFVIAALKKHKKGLRITEIAANVLEAGYRSQSANFQNVIYQCLYNSGEIEHDPNTGRYLLKKS